ncbi:ABC transporter ATP-binding protein [Companilactobacillus suantsaicola]|uniref:ABC transporter ATP-binding protein n=1 Tax=Companilactobacillus suantsaicola TaxID=2487723 RepID=A0A4Z0JGT3_9LACO|nr:ABC transporter transmembrane domain-containing protein [Companilactobacillus suantsaicola]TGD21169.1 ABC transporter ATP-binding protein [Companilactobacillus suantsaicola]
MRKHFNLPFFSLAIIFSILAGLETPFNTITYSYIFKLITDKNIGMIVPAVIFIVFGYAIFCLLNYLKSIVVNKNIFLINNRLKKDYMFAKMSSVTADENDFESKNVSFVLNDLKLLEDNYWRQIFMLLGSVAMTLGTLIYALYSNVLVTLIFLGFMIFPTLAPKFFSHAIQDKTTSWSKNNQVLSGTVQNLLHGALLLRRYHATSGFSERLDESVSKMEQANANLKNQISLTNNVISFFVFTMYLFADWNWYLFHDYWKIDFSPVCRNSVFLVLDSKWL